MDTLTRDLHTALRSLRRSPGFAAVVILTLGLGIGANTAIFTLLDQVVLRRLPVPAAGALVQLDGPGRSAGAPNSRAFSYPMFRDLSEGTGLPPRSSRAPGECRAASRPGRRSVSAEMLSGNTFDTLGVTPALGRFFTPADDTAAAPPVLVLSDTAGHGSSTARRTSWAAASS
jgi:hypothetical protein